MRSRWWRVGGGLIALLLLAPQGGLTQQASDERNTLRFESLQKDIEALKAGQKAMLDELQEMKKLLSSRGEARGMSARPCVTSTPSSVSETRSPRATSRR